MTDADLMTLAEAVIDAARLRGARIVTAESCTGGLVAAALTEIAGASDAFDRGFVTYSNHAKTELLGVAPAMIARHGAVSEDVARAMAKGALAASSAAVAIAVTGVAGPGGSERKPEGRVCFGLARRGRRTRTETVEFGPIGRPNVRRRSTAHALAMLLDALAPDPEAS